MAKKKVSVKVAGPAPAGTIPIKKSRFPWIIGSIVILVGIAGLILFTFSKQKQKAPVIMPLAEQAPQEAEPTPQVSKPEAPTVVAKKPAPEPAPKGPEITPEVSKSEVPPAIPEEPMQKEQPPHVAKTTPEVPKPEAPTVVEEQPVQKPAPELAPKGPELTAKIPEPAAPPAITEESMQKAMVYFAFNSYNLDDVAKKVLQEWRQKISNFEDMTLYIEGHADSLGGEEHNVQLSEQRAKSAQQYIVNLIGIDPKKVKVEGFGEEKPIGENSTKEGRAKNRRCEIFLR